MYEIKLQAIASRLPVVATAILTLALLMTSSIAQAAPDVEAPTVKRGWLGVVLDMQHEGPGGRVSRAFPGSPAADAGLVSGDVIVSVDGEPIASNGDLIETVGAKAAGSRITLTLAGDPPREAGLILAIRPENPASYATRLVGEAAPEVEVIDVSTGSSRPLTPSDGKVRILEFWATWCPACRVAMPQLAAAVEALPAEQFELLAVSGEALALVQEYATEHGGRLRIVQSDNDAANDLYWVTALPSYFLIDRDGKIAAYSTGADGWRRLVDLAKTMTVSE